MIDGDVMKKLTFALDSCSTFKEHKAKVRSAQKKSYDEEAKQKQLTGQIAKAEGKGEDATQFKVQLAASKVGRVGYHFSPRYLAVTKHTFN